MTVDDDYKGKDITQKEMSLMDFNTAEEMMLEARNYTYLYAFNSGSEEAKFTISYSGASAMTALSMLAASLTISTYLL